MKKDFEQQTLNRVVKRAIQVSMSQGDAPYVVRFNEDAGDRFNYCFVRESNLFSGYNILENYENADILLRITGKMVQVLRGDFIYSEAVLMADNCGHIPQAVQVFELPWQRRWREDSEKLAAVVALRNSVRSTLGM